MMFGPQYPRPMTPTRSGRVDRSVGCLPAVAMGEPAEDTWRGGRLRPGGAGVLLHALARDQRSCEPACAVLDRVREMAQESLRRALDRQHLPQRPAGRIVAKPEGYI